MSNKIASIEIKTMARKVTVTDVKVMNKTRENYGAETIAVVSSEGFTKKAKQELEKQGAVCVTLPASTVRMKKD